MTVEKVKLLKTEVNALMLQNSHLVTWSDVESIHASFSSLSAVASLLEELEKKFKQPKTEDQSVFNETICYLKYTIVKSNKEFSDWLQNFRFGKLYLS